MPAKFNPFHQWLGFSPKISNPHHFQLLGVSTKVTGQAEIQNAVEAGVRKNLALLDKIPPEKHTELVRKLKDRIALAQNTLLDPEARQSYVEKLKKQAQAQKSVKTSANKPAPDNARPVLENAKSEAVRQTTTSQMTSRQASEKRKFTPPTIGGNPLAAPVKRVARSTNRIGQNTPEQSIPMAVPLGPGGVPVAASPAASSRQSIAVNSDGIPIDEVRIQKNSGSRRKQSKVGWIVGSLMVVSAFTGIVLIYLNWQSILALGGVDPDVVPAAPGVVLKTENPQSNDVAPPIGAPSSPSKPLAKAENKLPDLNLDEMPELDVDAVIDDPETTIVTGRDAKQQRKLDEANRKRMQAQGIEDLPGTDVQPLENSGKTENAGDPPAGEIVRLDQSQLARYRRQLERARRSLFRRDKSTALSSIELAHKILAEVQTDANCRFEDQQASLAALAGETQQVYELIDGFWNQVVDSCQTIPGGQEIVASDQTIGFVESDTEKFVVRHAGTNVTYEYYFCPPSLAVELAKQGAIPDVPTWNMQLAAFYALNQFNGKDYGTQIDGLLKTAEANGHDCSGIRHFAEFKFGEIGKPSEKIEVPADSSQAESVMEFREQYQYSDVERLAPGKARMLAELLLRIDSPNFEQHVVLLEEARRLAIRSGEAGMVEDSVVELANFANINQDQLLCASWTQMVGNDLSPSQCRSLVEIAIPLVKSGGGDAKSIMKLSKVLKRVSTEHGMADAVRRLNQLEKAQQD